VQKHGTAGQETDDNIIRRMRVACWITKATKTHSELLLFHGKNGYANAPQCYVMYIVNHVLRLNFNPSWRGTAYYIVFPPVVLQISSSELLDFTV
jgi:hypothetical protein